MCVGLMGVETQLYMEYPHIYMGLYGLNMDYMGKQWGIHGKIWDHHGKTAAQWENHAGNPRFQ